MCRLSRVLSRILLGEDRMLCAKAHERGWLIRHVLDLALYYRDGPDHCMRMAVHDERLARLDRIKGRHGCPDEGRI